MIVKGNLRAAMAYLEQFPETAELYQKGVALYQKEHYITYDVDEELSHYEVELPEGTQDYAVKFLDGFIMKSWLDYISFGETGTGGWSNGDGLIHCVRGAYDLQSEEFQVSLLKHEAQHAIDQARYKGITNEDLEYRAKLVELIYSRERRMLERFVGQADTTRADNGHGLSAEHIVRGFEMFLKKERSRLAGLPVETAQSVAQSLFAESSEKMAAKYHIS